MLTTGSSEASEWVDALGADLLALIRARGVPVARLTTITALPSPVRTRAAFAIEFSDGTRLKGRRLKSAPRAAAVARLRGQAGAGFAPILAQRGEAMLLAWIEGRSLASLDPIPFHILRRCGEMLGVLHALPGDLPADSAPTSPAEHQQKLVRNLDCLLEARVLDTDLAERALSTAAAERPETATIGIIHKDFCAENLVLDSEDSLFCVDDASLATGPHDLDLARTWYRWPMPPRDLAHFSAGYQQHRSLASFHRHYRFWMTCALVGSAATRCRSLAAGVQVPVERLRQLYAKD